MYDYNTAYFDTWTDDKGAKWVTCEGVTYGHYAGSIVGGANLKAIENDENFNIRYFSNMSGLVFSGYNSRVYTDTIFGEDDEFDAINPSYEDTDILIITEAMGTKFALIKVNEKNEDLIYSLESYPLLEDTIYYDMCSEAESEAMEYIVSDLFRSLKAEYENWDMWFTTECAKLGNKYPDDVFSEKAIELIPEAIEMANVSWVYENDTAWIDSDMFYKEWKSLFFDAIREEMKR